MAAPATVVSATAVPASNAYQIFNKYLGQSKGNQQTPAPNFNAIEKVDAAIQSGNLPASEVSTLIFLKALLRFAGNDATACDWVLSRPSQKTKSEATEPEAIEHVARLLYPRSVPRDDQGKPLSATTAGSLDKLRIALFGAEPMLILKVLLANGVNSGELPPGISITTGKLASWLFGLLSSKDGDSVNLDSQDLAFAAITATYGKMSSTAATKFAPHYDRAVTLVKVLRSLCRVVQEAEDVILLYAKRFSSIRTIATMSVERFKKKILPATESGKERDPLSNEDQRAAAIHFAAQRADCWNEHAWLSAMEARRSDFVPLEPPGLLPTERTTTITNQGKKQKPVHNNNLTDMFLLEDVACESCCSITSLSAYFADLMSLLGRTESKPGSGSSMLDMLYKRRPDLRDLELTCANSQTLIPYISLVNETLESYIRYKSIQSDGYTDARPSIIPYNTPEESESCDSDQAVPKYQTGNTDESVYTELVSKQLHPFSTFPYNKARNDAAQILNLFQLPFFELMETFRSRELMMTSLPAACWQDYRIKQDLDRGCAEVFARQSAAEYLGLNHVEFAAITRETFWPSWFADLMKGLKKPKAFLNVQSAVTLGAAKLWGYSSVAPMMDTTDELGLSFIKKQFMRRSELEFEEILDVIKSQSFNQDLVIVDKTGSGMFNNSLEDLRLLCNASSPPFTPLTENICFRLQSFIRLKTKLKWSTKALDSAIYGLRILELESLPGIQGARPTSGDLFAITPFVIKGLAAMVKLSKLCDREAISDPVELLPLWGPMDTYGDNSLLYTKFLTPALKSLSPVFDRPKDGSQSYLMHNTSYALLSDMEMQVCVGLSWPLQSFSGLRKAVGLDANNVELNLDTFTVLYRRVLLCRILGIAPLNCLRFSRIFFASHNAIHGKHPLCNPVTTLAVVEKWKRLFSAGWTLDTLCAVLDASTDASESRNVSISEGISIVTALVRGAQDMRNSFPFLFANAAPTDDNIKDCAARMYDGATASVIWSFVLGIQIKTRPVYFDNIESLNEALAASSTWPDKLSLTPDLGSSTPKAEVRLAGVPSPDDVSSINALKINLKLLEEAVKQVFNEALAPEEIIRQRLAAGTVDDETVLNDLKVILPTFQVTKPQLTQDPTPSIRKTELDREVEAEQVRLERKKAFIRLSSPLIIQDLLQTLASNIIKAAVPDLDAGLIPVLLSNIVAVPKPTGIGVETAMTALQSLSDRVSEAQELDAYFAPSATDVYTLSYAGTETQPILSINGIDIPFDKAKNTWRSFPMSGGQSYHLVANFPGSQLYWATAKSMASPFPANMLLTADSAQRATAVLQAVRRVANVCQVFKLSANEVQSFGRSELSRQSILQVDFSAPSLSQLNQLDQFREIRDGTTSKNLIGLFQWLSETTAANSSQVATQMSEATGWSARDLVELLRAKYEDNSTDAEQDQESLLNQKSLMASLSTLDALWSIYSAMKINKRMLSAAGSIESLPPLSTLIDLAQPRFVLSDVAKDTVAVYNLRARLTANQTSIADSHAMEDHRNALVAYLCQQDYIRDMHITDADGLLQYFLVDVQMGPQLQTSRIKQAISVVQLFAQRSLLGLEHDVAKTSLVREQWEWRQQYSLWEAHVKLFLYPENWLEPTIRDDKSQLFDDFEASLMKKDLTMETFMNAIKTYVYSLNDISSLEVVAYLHEPASSQAPSDKFHFFGCTRASPRVFYHRTLSLVQSYKRTGDGDVEQIIESVLWRPWTKIEMDIPVVETAWEGGRLDVTGSHVIPILTAGRLYLFMPQIMPKSIKNDSKEFKDDQKFETLSSKTSNDTKPKRAWEVTMAWTELVRGVWSPKRVSSESLTLATSEYLLELPLPHKFQFEPRYDTMDKNSTIVTILVNYPQREDSESYSSMGGFLFCEDQIMALKTVPGETPGKRWALRKDNKSPLIFLVNSFQQLRMTDAIGKFSSQQLVKAHPAEKAMIPLMWIPKALKDIDGAVTDKRRSSTIAWTMSFSKKSSTTVAFILSSQRLNGTSVSYFTLPKTDLESLRAYRDANDKNNLDNSTELVVMDHTFAHELMQAAAGKADPLKDMFGVLSQRKSGELAKVTFGGIERTVKTEKGVHEVEIKCTAYHELAQPAAIYNWEASMHTVLLAMDRFSATQQFNEALEVARLVFDPTAEVTVSDTEQSCWKFPPFQHVASQLQKREKGVNLKLANLANDADFNLAIMERRSHGALVHATARGRPEAYMKWMVIKYAETLIAAGDVQFRRGTLESLPLAIQRYIEASHILGPVPAKIPKLGKRKKPKTFASLADEDEKLELGLPFSRTLMNKPDGEVKYLTRGKEDARRESMVCYLRTTYFCVPLNPKFKELRNVVNERLFNIRNSLDIQGRSVTYALIEPPIDPGALIALSQGGGSVSDVIAMLTGGDQDSPLPRQRFEVLLRRAQELCHELRGLGERLLGAIEKREIETFSAVRARHATVIRKMTLELKRSHLTEAQSTVESLLLSRDSQVSQLTFYLDLIGEPRSLVPSAKSAWEDIGQDIDTPTKDDLRMSSNEKMEMNMADAASLLNLVAAGIDAIVAPLCAIPEVEANGSPLGVGASVTVGGRAISKAVAAGSSYIKVLGMIAGDEGSRASRKAQLTRQLQDRRLQANIRGREIKSIDKQIEIQQLRVKAALREIDIEEAEIADATQIETWYRTKYSNAQLYGWMEKSLRSLYYQAYTLAITTARRAESALSFEHGKPVSILRSAGYFSNGHDGLLAADYLYLDLARLEAAYHETRSHDFELSKTISLRQLDPLALLTLRLTGSTTFSLSENLFDMDFPGHYMRRIRSVAVTIPAVIGPHSGINATLRLMGHRYRVSSTATTQDYAAGDKIRSAFRNDYIPISSVAISSGSHDSGVFELSFTGVKYAPFEGAGAISTWRLDLPTEVRKFNYESISDMLVHLQFTASDGGAMLRKAARETVLSNIKTIKNEGRDQGFWAALDLKNDFVNEWHSFSNGAKTATGDIKFDLGPIKARLPFWARQQPELAVRGLTWVSKHENMIKNLSMVGVDAPKSHDDILLGTLDKSTLKRWRNVETQATITDATTWQVVIKAEDIDKEQSLSTMYMLIHYVFA